MELDPEELANSDAPFFTALEWVQQVTESNDPQSWFALTDTLRRWFAQDWLSKNPAALLDPAAESRDRDELVEILVSESGPDNDLFQHLWRVSRRGILGAVGPFKGEELTVGTRPRTVGPGLEAVRLFRASDTLQDDGSHSFEPGAVHVSLVLLLSHEGEKWLIASVGSWLPVLGWPPQFEELTNEMID